ncbi:MAG: translation initiation factor IF-3 [Patescibacteria group bacterium]
MRIHYKRHKKPQFDAGLQYRANHAIRVPSVRVIDAEGVDIGVLPIQKAIALAEESELDLVEVAPKAEPPVCRIIDYGQFKYQKEKEYKAKKVHARKVEVKGIRLSVKIGEHDLDIRRDKAKEFLEDGQKVKIEIILRGREKAHGDLAGDRIQEFIDSLKDAYEIYIEQPVKRQGGNVSAIVGRK